MEIKHFCATSGVRIDYLLHRIGPGTANGRLPLIVYLHGTDGCGDDPTQSLEIKSLASFIEGGTLTSEQDAIVLSPQCKKGRRWDAFATEIAELIADMAAHENADPDRVALTGASLGGMGTFSIAILYPSLFSCLVPVCGSVKPAACDVLTTMPVWIFHGTEDTGMGFSVVEAASRIRAAGGNCKLTLLPGEGHEIRWIYTAPRFDIVRWMCTQKRCTDAARANPLPRSCKEG